MFDIINDPTEHNEISAQHPGTWHNTTKIVWLLNALTLFVEFCVEFYFGKDVVENLTARFEEIQATVWWSGGNATFAGDEVCDTVNNHSGFMAPYKGHPEVPPSREAQRLG